MDFKAKAKKEEAKEEVVEAAPVPKAAKKKAPEVNDYKPMLAKLAAQLFEDPDWIYEKKLDGYRAVAFTSLNKKTSLFSRNGIDFKSAYAPVIKALDKLKVTAVIDGEVVAENKHGEGEFQILQNYRQSGELKGKLKFYAFDLLNLDGHDLRGLELLKRKELLKVIIKKLDDPIIIYSEHVEGTGKKLLAEAESKGWEGIIGKAANSTYSSDKRSGNWLKFKINKRQEAIIIGYTKPAGSRHYFGSLVLGMYKDKELVYTGNCGTGFNAASLKRLHAQMDAIKTSVKPVKEKVDQERTITWIKPKLVCDVVFTEWTDNMHLRHPVFKGLREDKTADSVTIVPAES
ncbi:MAG: ATP-dependent DNA ligase, partial [Chitinophagaceae bacterium]